MKRKLNRILSLVVVACIAVMLAGCSEKAKVPQDYKNLNFDEYIKLLEYEGLEYTDIKIEVTKDEIKNEVDRLLSSKTESVDVTTGEVKNDSVIKVDYQGVIEGEVNDLATGEGLIVDVANGSFIDGFKEGMPGHKVGDEFTLHLKFPDDYGNTDLAGKPVDFNIKITAIVEQRAPEYTDEFVKENTDFETIADYEADIENSLKEEKEENAKAQQRQEIFLKIKDGSEFLQLPEEQLTARGDKIRKTYQDLAAQNNMEYADVITMYTGLTEEEFEEQVTTAAENAVKQELVLNALAKQEGVTINDDIYTDFLDDLLEKNDLDRKSFEEQFGQSIFEYAEDNDLYSALLYEKVMDAVLEKCVAK